MAEICTLCYIEKDDKYLLLHRIKKENDINHDKWIGVGGHIENGESPEDCVRREILEETGLTVRSLNFRGFVTFISGNVFTEYMTLFTAEGVEGTLRDCDEGELVWIPKSEIYSLKIWEGDKIFLKLIENDKQPFFSLKLVYDDKESLIQAVLNGKELPL